MLGLLTCSSSQSEKKGGKGSIVESSWIKTSRGWYILHLFNNGGQRIQKLRDHKTTPNRPVVRPSQTQYVTTLWQKQVLKKQPGYILGHSRPLCCIITQRRHHIMASVEWTTECEKDSEGVAQEEPKTKVEALNERGTAGGGELHSSRVWPPDVCLQLNGGCWCWLSEPALGLTGFSAVVWEERFETDRTENWKLKHLEENLSLNSSTL